MVTAVELREALNREAHQLIGVAFSLERQRDAFGRSHEHLSAALEGSAQEGAEDALRAVKEAREAIVRAQAQAKRANVVLNLMAANL